MCPDMSDAELAESTGMPASYWRALRALPMTEAQKKKIAEGLEERRRERESSMEGQ
jgi:hypothetical protein